MNDDSSHPFSALGDEEGMRTFYDRTHPPRWWREYPSAGALRGSRLDVRRRFGVDLASLARRRLRAECNDRRSRAGRADHVGRDGAQRACGQPTVAAAT